MRFLFILLVGICLPSILLAQPANDECVNAIPLTDVVNWCSAPAAYSTSGATISAEPSPGCFPNNTDNNDVWFSFVAEATTINVSMIGGVANTPGGTIQNPQVAVYSGECGTLTEIGCASDANNVDQVNTFVNPLNIGDTYYIRVSARFSFTGTFQLCLNNFNEVPQPSSDCEPGVILCDKSPFTVDFVTGEGNNPNEINNTSCNSATCQFTEASSSWYKWTCDQSGTLAFSITPLNPRDDIDFVVYELPNGIEDCSGKFDIRCMASGENVGSPLSEWQPCTGATGLSLTDTDVTESCGCQPGDNNFAQAIDMVAGRSYALVINNFSESGSGFSMEFGGTGTFLGPVADFNVNPITACVGEAVTFTDASSFIGGLSGWTWNFGPNATPSSSIGPGPHSVVFNRPGTFPVVLTVESNQGCLVTKISYVTVECCVNHFNIDALVTDVDCPNDPSGSIDMTVMTNYGPYTYLWSNGAVTEDLLGILPGIYDVTIVDQATCEETATFTVNSPPPFAFDTLITMPTCNGGTDGAVTLIVSGGSPPYEYNWNNMGFGTNNSLNNLSNGDYTVIVRDANGCDSTLVIPVFELELQLDPSAQAITPPSCFGSSDGSIVVTINNGLPPYEYNFNDGSGYVSNNTLTGLPAGTYIVDVLDANLCMGSFELVLEDFPPLTLDFDIMDVSCNGLSDGNVAAVVGGGTGVYTYLWSNNATTATIDQLAAGNYSVTVWDSNDCEILGTAPVIEPPPLFVDIDNIIDVICFGESTGEITVVGSGGLPPYEYSLDGNTFQISPTFSGLAAGDYTITILDANGCTEIVDAIVNQPPELIVDLGPDIFINLGFETSIRAVANFFPVTFTWDPEEVDCLNADCSHIRVMPFERTTYTVTITDENGCTAVDEIVVRVVKNRPIYIPNAISPNGDGVNDGFTVYSGPAAHSIKTFKIFSRWGSLVFETNDIPTNDESLGWDGTFLGKPVNPGVFAFFAEVEFIDGEVVLYEGDVTVIR
ncbi:MAG: hypothetical protein DHS20C18_05120 [Saprospiraceae bacterium]|nr:MAG: hypothetical protein DHS20C18_05120 [Saprospiraceae bacterium]